ncbi:MAG: 4Fe-4S dicluster domain-containing protein, partial [Rhodothermia bacterium]|nr:4Fe-4S dicluster domain-containing protein [Rhodothermia bacterium]
LMSPATADRLGFRWRLSEGKYHVDVIEIVANGSSVRLPIWVLPGHADDTITLYMGYGRDIASDRPERQRILFDLDHYTDVYGGGSISSGVGGNVGPLRESFSRITTAESVTRVDGGYLVATTQDHGALAQDRVAVERRDPVQLATLAQYRDNPTFARDAVPPLPGADESWEDYPALWQENHPTTQPAYKDNPYYEYQWGMVIDLNSCTGCGSCIVACQSENNVQVVGKEEVSHGREMHWIRMDRYFVSGPSGYDNPSMVMQPVPCMHCENAPCESVCPVAATIHSPDGTNQMIYNRCIGTRYCANNCPYKVRRFNFYNWSKTLPTSVRMAHNPDVTVRSRGVMEKCSYCIQRVRAANIQSNLEDRPIKDGEVQTACQQACPAKAITFGNINDPDSAVSIARNNSRRYELLAQLSVKPRTSYLGRVTNPNPVLSANES